MPRRSSILRKGLAVIAIPIVFQLLFAGFLLVRQESVDDVGRWAIHTKEVIAAAEAMFRGVLEVDSAVRAFAMTGDRSFDDPLDRTARDLPPQTTELVSKTKDNPLQQGRAREIGLLVDQFIRERRELREIARGSTREAAMDKLQEVQRLERVKQIRGKLERFLAEEQRLDQQRVARLRVVQKQQFSILTGGLVALLAIGGVSAWVFSLSIVQRINVLNANVKRMSAGEALAPIVSGHDEIGELDTSFHRMAQDLAGAAEKEKLYQQDLERRAVELSATNRELQQKSDENEMFVYSVSHDLRSPLVNLQGFGKELGMAMNELKAVFVEGGVPPATRTQVQSILEHGMAEPIHFIQTAVTRLSAIIDALLRLSRAGRVEYQRTLVDVQAVVTRVVDATHSTKTQKGARIDIRGPLPTVWADPTAVEQIFGNLVGNALNYLDPARPGQIEIAAAPEEATPGMSTFSVRDNGLGIPEAYLAKIFSIFQRVHGNVAPGEGIGLALVRRMVDRHGGRIWVESVEGAGSTFFVLLPTEPPPADPAPAQGEPQNT